MRLIIQRVTSSSVTSVTGSPPVSKLVSKIGPGVNVLVGITSSDTKEDVEYCVKKLLRVKLWDRTLVEERVSDSKPGKMWSISLQDEPTPSEPNTPTESENPGTNTSVTETVPLSSVRQLLLVSQFTLHAKLAKPKPDFHAAMKGDEAVKLFELMVEECRKGLAGKQQPQKKNKFKGKGKGKGEGEDSEENTKGENPEEPPPDFTQRVQTGAFGEMMHVDIQNDGPVTIVVDSEEGVKRPEPVPLAAEGGAKGGDAEAVEGNSKEGGATQES